MMFDLKRYIRDKFCKCSEPKEVIPVDNTVLKHFYKEMEEVVNKYNDIMKRANKHGVSISLRSNVGMWLQGEFKPHTDYYGNRILNECYTLELTSVSRTEIVSKSDR